MDDEYLEELVRKRLGLHDVSQTKYVHCNFRQDIWNRIEDEMKVDGKYS